MPVIRSTIKYVRLKYIHFKYKLLRIFRKINPYVNSIVISINKKCTRTKVALFSIHLNQLKLAKYIILSCIELSNNGYDVILIVTHDESLDLKSVEELFEKDFKSYYIIIRGNYGKDFGGFKDGLKHIESTKYTDVILMNDSMIGPLFYSTFIADIDKCNGDVIGITDSFDSIYHLQSSFLKFSGSDNTKLLNEFFNNYEPTNDREIVVRFGEIALSQYFINHNKILVPYVSSIQLWSDSGYVHKIEDNAQHAYWAEIIFKHKVPYIKRELIVSDPSNFLRRTENKLSKESLDIIHDGLKYRLK